MDARPPLWIPISRATARDMVLFLLREVGHAGLAANYEEHRQLSLDLNEPMISRRLHIFKARQYAKEIAAVLECNNWRWQLDDFLPENKI